MANRPSMRDGLSELFRRTDVGGDAAPPGADADEQVVTGRAYVTTIKVVGVGGGGTNAVNRMVDSGIRGVEFIAVNTDSQALQTCDADVKIHVGQEITHGLGGGADPEVGRQAVEASRDQIKQALKGADMVFVTAGEGGGTGTGAAPVDRRRRARARRADRGDRHPAVLVRGPQARGAGAAGIDELAAAVDTVIVIPNDRLLQVVDGGPPWSTRSARRRHPAPGRAGHLRPDHGARAHQPRLRRRAHHHERRRRGAHGHRQRPRRGRANEAAAHGHQLAAPRDLDQRGPRHPAQHHRRQRPVALRGQRGGRRDRRWRPTTRPTSSSARSSTSASKAS